MLKLFVLLMCTFVVGFRPGCNQESVLQQLSTPTYNFSVQLLERVAKETDGHFVFSPISIWLQLLALAEGAEGETLEEISKITQEYLICSRNIVRDVFNSLDRELSDTINLHHVFVIDELLDVKDSFVNEVEMLNTAKVVKTSFSKFARSTANNDIEVKDTFTDLLDVKDFKMRVLLISDSAKMKVKWDSPFNPANTKRETFYSYENVPIGSVNMMQQTGSFFFNDIPKINAQAVELPIDQRTSIILLLPYKGRAEELLWTLENVSMQQIFNQLEFNGPKLINLKMPRFNITTEIDNIPELLDDMGLIRVFSPSLAELSKISDYRVHVSLMANKFDIEVTEMGVAVNITPQNLGKRDDSIDVTFNRPFVFLLVDKTIDVILFAGIYSKPSLF